MARLYVVFEIIFKINKIKINARRWKQLGFSSVEIVRYLVQGSILDFAKKKKNLYITKREFFLFCKRKESKNLFPQICIS